MTTFSEGNYLSDVLKWEEDGQYSREEVTVLAGSGSARTLLVGTVIGKATKDASAIVLSAVTGSGDGVRTAGAVGAKGVPGVYRATCITAGATGVFEIEDPDGKQLQTNVTIGGGATNVDDHFTITIADGSADYAVGDTFTITISAGTGKVVQLAPSATDGTEDAYGIIGATVTAPDGTDKKSFAIVRDAVVSEDGLVWPGGISAADKATAIAALAAKGIIIRDGV